MSLASLALNWATFAGLVKDGQKLDSMLKNLLESFDKKYNKFWIYSMSSTACCTRRIISY